MNLSASVACITNNYNRRLNIYSVNQNATSYNVKRKRRSKRKGSLESSTSTSRSSSILRHALTDPTLLYEISSRDCPCDHHRLQRLRESQRLQHSDADPDVDSLVINTFEASVAPFREFLTASSSTTGDSGVNTNSNGSQRSSGRLDKPFKRTFSFSSSSADSSAYDNLDNEVITTVILEHHGCEIVADQHSNNRAHRKSQPFQISPTNDPSQNWTLSTPTTTTLSSTEDTYDSLFSSLKTSHSSSLKELCTCTSDSNLTQLQKSSSKPNHTELHRVASWPRSAPDPHRFDLILNAESKVAENQELKQLPTVPPQRLLQQDFWSIAAVPESISVQELRLGLDSYYPHHPHSEIPPCVRKVIMQQLQSPTPPPHNPKMIKKLSRTITLPEDPSDPTAFTIPYDASKHLPSRSRRSRQVIKIVGTFSFLMTMGIVITVLLCLYWSDTFKPMTMTK